MFWRIKRYKLQIKRACASEFSRACRVTETPARRASEQMSKQRKRRSSSTWNCVRACTSVPCCGTKASLTVRTHRLAASLSQLIIGPCAAGPRPLADTDLDRVLETARDAKVRAAERPVVHVSGLPELRTMLVQRFRVAVEGKYVPSVCGVASQLLFLCAFQIRSLN